MRLSWVPLGLQWMQSLLVKVGKMCHTNKKTLEWLAQSDESTSFQTRGLLEGFRGNEQATSPNDEVLSKRG
jgi:hypothetical protein